ncbi:DNA-packaging protein FI [Escherichia coli]
MTSKETFTHYQPLGNSDPAHTATAPGGLSAKAPAMTPLMLTGHENEVVSAQTDTVTDTAALVTVVALVTLHTDALHATRDEAVAFVLPGTAFRVSAGVAAEMTERGLARMQ